ncbi:rod shape-determining protein MreD [Defluviimonas sp. SAOS-178_SWC]|uniref:rod shape-determining protein MreD n=1 Tax=Defluviimonas sp. SAOS-178_SWC TaxID=3121287 RepID=UPI00322143C8
MVDPIAASRLGYRLLFVGLAALILFIRILPLNAVPVRFPGPDLILCLTLVWVLRRPDYVPALLIAGVLLLDDILAMRPPGLWTLIVLLGTEYLRSREATLRGIPFALEWLIVGALIAAMTVVNGLVLALFLVPQAGTGLIALQMLATIVVYPLVVLATLFVFRLRKAAPGEVDALGHRL